MKYGIIIVMIIIIITLMDGAAYSFGVEYDSTGGLGINYNSANDFAKRFRDAGWTQSFLWGNSAAFEKDFKDYTKGGWDRSYADAVDFTFFEGHGSPDAIHFPSSIDDSACTYNDAIWGDWNLEWLAAHSCSVLADDYLSYWAYWVMGKGGHMMCSHKTTVNACNAGDRFAQLMISGVSIKDAWFTQHLEKQYTGCTARVIATSAAANDHLWGRGSVGPDSASGDTWYVWTLTK